MKPAAQTAAGAARTTGERLQSVPEEAQQAVAPAARPADERLQSVPEEAQQAMAAAVAAQPGACSPHDDSDCTKSPPPCPREAEAEQAVSVQQCKL